jgi:endonuclease I
MDPGETTLMSKRIKSAKIVTASERFLLATEGMTDIQRVNFMIAYWFALDRYPKQTYRDFLLVWKRWQTQKAVEQWEQQRKAQVLPD